MAAVLISPAATPPARRQTAQIARSQSLVRVAICGTDKRSDGSTGAGHGFHAVCGTRALIRRPRSPRRWTAGSSPGRRWWRGCCRCPSPRSPTVAEALIGELAPRVVVSIGLWPGEPVIRIERVALNVADFEIPDNRGQLASRTSRCRATAPSRRWRPCRCGRSSRACSTPVSRRACRAPPAPISATPASTAS